MSRSQVLQEIRRLDPEKDCQRIVFLTVCHEFPFEWLRATKIGLFKAFCSPEFSGTLARTGAVVQRTENRDDNTVVLFIGLMEYGYDSPEGRAALRFINRQHQPYPISEDAYRYTYAAIVMEPIRFVKRFGWRQLDEKEKLAQFYFWREIARFMNVRHYFESLDELARFYEDFERREFRFAETNHTLAQALLDLRISQFPKPLRAPLATAMLSMFDDDILDMLGLPHPHPLGRALTVGMLKARAHIVRYLPPRKAPVMQTRLPHPSYPEGFSMERAVARTPRAEPLPPG
jgi:hypothetical protein